MGYIDLWLADMDQHVDDLARFESVLTVEERTKRIGIRLERVRNQSILSRGILRSVLAPYVNCDANDVEFETEPLGKPRLSDRHVAAVGHEIYFNVSHSEGLLAIAVNSSGPVGVDIEKVRKIDQLDTIASTLFSTEQQRVLSKLGANERLDLFFKYWVHREAVTKALGVGLLEHVEIEYPMQTALAPRASAVPLNELSSRNCVSKLSGSVLEWSWLEFSPRTGYTGCIAVGKDEHTLRTRWF